MSTFFDLDWSALFGVNVTLLEMIVRGTVVYWFLFIIFRFVVPRDVGKIGIADILILVIIADASQNAMAGEYTTITEGMVLISVLVAWNVIFDRLSFYSPAFRRFTTPSLRCLVKDGRIQKQNMRREFITEDELWTHLRQQGIETLSDVRTVYLESDGGFSVVKTKK